MSQPKIAVEPRSRPEMRTAFVDAVADGGGVVVELDDAEALVWADPTRPDALPAVLEQARGLRWVQLPYAGIEPFVGHLHDGLVWTCGKGVYARPVAEHALGLALAGLRGIGRYARADHWSDPVGRNLLDARVAVLGGGGIARCLLELLAPFGTRSCVVRRSSAPVPGAARVLPPDGLLDAVGDADLVVVALALTPATAGLVDRRVLEAMPDHAWLVNVARGPHVVTDDLVDALAAERIGGAALDVTEPEPLPTGHPLWSLPNCIVTPHIANTPEMGLPLIAARVRDNVVRFGRGAPLEGTVDIAAGY